MEQITNLILFSHATTEEGEAILKAVIEYGRSQWIEGFNRAANIAGVETPHAPQIRTEPRTNLKNTGI